MSSAHDVETRLEEMVEVAQSLAEDLNTTLGKKKRKSKPAEPCRWIQRDEDGNIVSETDDAETHLEEMDKVAQSLTKDLNTTLGKKKRKSKPAEPCRWIQRDEDGNIVAQTSNMSSADDGETHLEEMVKVAKSLTEDLNTTLGKKKGKSKPAETSQWIQRDEDGNIVSQTSNMLSADDAETHLEERVEAAQSLIKELNTTLVKKKRKSKPKPAKPYRWRERDEDGNIVAQTSNSPSSNSCAKRVRSSTPSVPEGNQ
ncbi:uncharacterized protein LOC133014475 isoform X2 [Limanda limanda]|uniref:uncharacterized protein LOC133014475 isoform X2 n=1 Tax=Limanda limanda TaxID=27771 RepID=UPI0029C89C7E|nr:uncharacterized protein LOC133014475 isoform X2 [Limanda limanda]